MICKRIFPAISLFLLLLVISGCSELLRFSMSSTQEHNLNDALTQLGDGKEQQARVLLEKVVDSPPLAGVSDEALFRLAILDLRPDGVNGLVRSQRLLERLVTGYPDSPWTKQSAPLLSHLIETKNLRNRQRDLKTLKELNFSLSRDNRELRQNLDRLKQLDLELEKKINR